MISPRSNRLRNCWPRASTEEPCPGSKDFARGAAFANAALLIIGLGLIPTSFAAPGQKRWEYRTEIGRAVQSSAAISVNGLLYVGSGDTRLYALDASTGEKRWSCCPTRQAIIASPAVGPDGTVYVVCVDGSILAFDEKLGSPRWQARIGGAAYSSPALGPDGTVYVGSEDKRIYAFDGANGTQKWVFQTAGRVWSSPSIGLGGMVYVGSYDCKVYALDASTGLKRWEFMTGGSVIGSPAIAPDGRLFVGSEDGKVYALGGGAGAKLWEFTTGGAIWSSAAVAPDGAVYVGSDDGKLHALDGNTGLKRWEYDAGAVIWSSPALSADGAVYFGCENGYLYAVEGTTGGQLWGFKTGGQVRASPAIGPDGTVYVGTTDGKVFAVEGSTGLSQSSWPKFRGNAQGSGITWQLPPAPPRILWQPEMVPVKQGSNGVLAVVATSWGAGFCWYRDGVAIPGATNAAYLITAAKPADEGLYTLVISNSLGQTMSQPIAVVVSNVDTERAAVLDWEADSSGLFNLQWTDELGPSARWDGFLYPTTGSGPIVVPGRYLAKSVLFFRLVGLAESRINRIGAHAAFKLMAPGGSRCAIEYVSRETGWTNWQVLTNLVLTTSNQLFVDRESSWTVQRVYRVNWQP